MNDPVVFGLLILGLLVLAVVLTLWAKRQSAPDTPPAPQTVALTPGLGLAKLMRRVLGDSLDDATWDRLEESLLSADIGVVSTTRIVSSVRDQRPSDSDEARRLVAAAVRAEFGSRPRSLDLDGDPAIVLVVGVNGSGKTTTIAKLARRFLDEGRSVQLAAGDTFRAAAVEQLELWGERLRLPVTRGAEGADPAAVAYDAVTSAKARGVDVVVVDTAGRLHSKRNLMEELGKVHRVASQAGRVSEVLLVLDATTGQNGLAQVRDFAAAVPLTGVVLSKMDGTARGGIVVAVESELGVPVKMVGTGERETDLAPFDPDEFVADLTA
jgi:fused signal recognition particle receptor